MNLKQLHYFLAIAEEGQITAAAKRLHIAQPPLSYQLRLLEEELGVTLVKRGSRNITLTGAGELLRKRAEQILSLTSSTAREVGLYGDGAAGTLSIGTISSSSRVVPNENMLTFAQQFPDIRFDVHEGNSFEVIDMLEKGIVEVGIVRTPFPEKKVDIRYASLEPMIAVMPGERIIGEQQDTITLQELQQEPLVIYRRFEELIHTVFAQEDLVPFVCCINEDARTTLTWTEMGFGIGIVPLSALSGMEQKTLIYKKIAADELYTRLAVIWEKSRYLSPLAQKFVEMFSESAHIS